MSPLSTLAEMMGCCYSSEDEWMENIEICEICHYPIDPDARTEVRDLAVQTSHRFPYISASASCHNALRKVPEHSLALALRTKLQTASLFSPNLPGLSPQNILSSAGQTPEFRL